MDENIDEETLKIMISYCGCDPRIARKTTVEVFNEYGSADWDALEFKDAIDEAINEIPEECRAEAVVSLEGGYEESTCLRITYPRPENQDEISKRVKGALDYARNKQAQELYTYKELKKKFEKESP